MDTEAFKKAVSYFGSQSAMARALGCRQSTLSNAWIGKNKVSPEYSLRIHELTGGYVRADELRPDLPWHVLNEKFGRGRRRNAPPNRTQDTAQEVKASMQNGPE